MKKIKKEIRDVIYIIGGKIGNINNSLFVGPTYSF
jgi:hypothetical protein